MIRQLLDCYYLFHLSPLDFILNYCLHFESFGFVVVAESHSIVIDAVCCLYILTHTVVDQS